MRIKSISGSRDPAREIPVKEALSESHRVAYRKRDRSASAIKRNYAPDPIISPHYSPLYTVLEYSEHLSDNHLFARKILSLLPLTLMCHFIICSFSSRQKINLK